MANILPVSDLRNYNEVLKNCHKGEPVYLTKNGRGRVLYRNKCQKCESKRDEVVNGGKWREVPENQGIWRV